MNRLNYNASINATGWQVINPHYSLFTGEDCMLFFVQFIAGRFSLDTSGELTSWITSVCLTVCPDQFAYLIIDSYFLSHRQNVHFLLRYLLQRQSFCYFHMVHQSVFSSEHLLFSLSSTVFTCQVDFSLFWSLNLLSSSNCFQVPDCFLCFCGCCECCYRE